MLVLTAPRAQKPRRSVEALKTSVSAATSMGSPMAVPVPCVSTYDTVDGSTSARASASAMALLCPSTLGAVKPTLAAPSLLMAEPFTTAWMVSPSRRASARRLRATTPQPLPPTVPPARASKARQWPSGERMPPSWHR